MEDWFTRKYDGDYSPELSEKVRSTFNNSASLTEAFFGLHAQFDMLIEEYDVFLGDGEKQAFSVEWTAFSILEAVDEATDLAKKQNSPAWPALMSIAAAMRAMVRTVPIMPSTEFEQNEGEGIPPGLYALTQNEAVRPVDLVVAAIAEDLSSATLVNSAVMAERARCESFVKDRIKDVLGDKDPDDLDSANGWAYEQFERVRREISMETEDETESFSGAAEESAGDSDVDPPSSGVGA